MPTQILMPALSPTMEEGKLARWVKSEGDAVRSGDVIAEIETDKATMEIEAVDEGKLGKDFGAGRDGGREGQYADCSDPDRWRGRLRAGQWICWKGPRERRVRASLLPSGRRTG